VTLVTYFDGSDNEAPAYMAVPKGEGTWPAVVVVQDVLGMTADLRRTADRLAENGYLALAPSLYGRGPKISCMIATLRAATAGIGTGYVPLVAARDFLLADERCTGKVGLLGFCMGGQLALQLSVGGLFDVCASNYGVLPKNVAVAGYRVTAGTTLAIGRRSVQRDPALWESPNTFDPDRFSPQQSAARDRWSYLPFGAGPRSCIGQHFAMQQATLALADITRRFEIDSLSNDFPTTVAFTVTPDGPVPAQVRARNPVGGNEIPCRVVIS